MDNNSHLKDIATVLTSESFNALYNIVGNRNNVRYILAPKKFEYGNTFFFEQKAEVVGAGFVIIAKPNYPIQYISFLLNSLMVAIDLCNGNLSEKIVLSKKRLEMIPIRLCSDNHIHYLGLCNRIIQVITKRMIEEPENEIYKYHYNLFSEIRDGMSMELYIKPLFDEYGITIINEWVKFIDRFTERPSINQMVNVLMDDDNKLMNQIRKMRIVISNMVKFISEIKKP